MKIRWKFDIWLYSNIWLFFDASLLPDCWDRLRCPGGSAWGCLRQAPAPSPCPRPRPLPPPYPRRPLWPKDSSENEVFLDKIGYDWAIVLLTILGLQNIPKQKLYDHYDIHVMTIHNLWKVWKGYSLSWAKNYKTIIKL